MLLLRFHTDMLKTRNSAKPENGTSSLVAHLSHHVHMWTPISCFDSIGLVIWKQQNKELTETQPPSLLPSPLVLILY